MVSVTTVILVASRAILYFPYREKEKQPQTCMMKWGKDYRPSDDRLRQLGTFIHS